MKVNVLIEKEYVMSVFPVANITTSLPTGEVFKSKKKFLTNKGYKNFINEVQGHFNVQQR